MDKMRRQSNEDFHPSATSFRRRYAVQSVYLFPPDWSLYQDTCLFVETPASLLSAHLTQSITGSRYASSEGRVSGWD